MATLHETAYPRLKPDPTTKELEEIYTPTAAEIAFAKQLTTQPGPQLAVLIHLKLFQRLGYFTVLAEVPERIRKHIAKAARLGRVLDTDQLERYDASGSQRRHMPQLRQFIGVRPLDKAGLSWLDTVATGAAHPPRLGAEQGPSAAATCQPHRQRRGAPTAGQRPPDRAQAWRAPTQESCDHPGGAARAAGHLRPRAGRGARSCPALLRLATGGRRRSEVAAATLAHLRALPEGGFVYHLDQGKTLQDGPQAGGSPDKPLLGAAATALQAWLDAAKLTEGALFRRVWGSRVGLALSDRAIALIIQRRAVLAGLDGDFGGHSLRSGFITEGARQWVALPALMAMTDHRSVASVIGYFQQGAAGRNPAARLLDED
jgi:integrase